MKYVSLLRLWLSLLLVSSTSFADLNDDYVQAIRTLDTSRVSEIIQQAREISFPLKILIRINLSDPNDIGTTTGTVGFTALMAATIRLDHELVARILLEPSLNFDYLKSESPDPREEFSWPVNVFKLAQNNNSLFQIDKQNLIREALRNSWSLLCARTLFQPRPRQRFLDGVKVPIVQSMPTLPRSLPKRNSTSFDTITPPACSPVARPSFHEP